MPVRLGPFYVAEPLSSILDAIEIRMHSLKVAGKDEESRNWEE
jgi:hypothetical protein